MNRHDKWELVHEIRAIPDMDYDVYVKLGKIGKLARLHKRLCEDACNGIEKQYINGKEITTDERIKQVEVNIRKYVDLINTRLKDTLTLEFQHDPRGLTVKLSTSGGNILLWWLL